LTYADERRVQEAGEETPTVGKVLEISKGAVEDLSWLE